VSIRAWSAIWKTTYWFSERGSGSTDKSRVTGIERGIK
jgi:hypothetical protein